MRLTNAKRDKLVNQIIDKMFKKEYEALRQKKIDLGCELLALVVDITEVNKLPDGWLPSTNQIETYFPNSKYFRVTLPEEVRYPYKYNSHYSILVPADKVPTKLEKKITDCQYSEKDLDERVRQTDSEVRSVLYSVSTTKKLEEVWPDIFKFVEIETDEPKQVTQLSPLISKFNEKLMKAS